MQLFILTSDLSPEVESLKAHALMEGRQGVFELHALLTAKGDSGSGDIFELFTNF